MLLYLIYMDKDSIEIRQLESKDVHHFRALRLQGIIEAPAAFLHSAAEFEALTDSEVAGMIGPTESIFVMGIFNSAGKLIAKAGIRRDFGEKLKHKALIWGVYVTPDERGKGYSRQLLKSLIEEGHKRFNLQKINLTVSSSQIAAKNLYASLGFKVYGREQDSLIVAGEYYHEELMSLLL